MNVVMPNRVIVRTLRVMCQSLRDRLVLWYEGLHDQPADEISNSAIAEDNHITCRFTSCSKELEGIAKTAEEKARGERKARLEAEKKVNDERAAEIAKKRLAELEAKKAEEAAAQAAEAPAEETPAEEAPVAEAPAENAES